MCSGYESGCPSNVTWCATTTTGSGQRSSTVSRFGTVRRGSAGMSRGTARPDGGIRPKYCRREFDGLPGLDVAGDDHRRVRRHVVGPVEVAHVVHRRRVEIGHRADRRVPVRMHGEREAVHDLRQPAVWLVLDAHPPLFLHHLPLPVERRPVDAQRRHAVRFEPERHRQVLRRHRLPEHGDVLGGVRVGLPADAGHERRVLLGFHVLRTLEHQVLEQVGEPGAARAARSSSRRGTTPGR